MRSGPGHGNGTHSTSKIETTTAPGVVSEGIEEVDMVRKIL